MRSTTLAARRDSVLFDSADSAAATVTISAPTIEKMTVVTPVRIAVQPNGAKPWCAVRFETPGLCGLPTPSSQPAATMMNTTMAATLIDANQNSNSPYERADARFTAVSIAMSPSPICHTSSIGSHACAVFAPTSASNATTTTQNHQYIQPVMNPAPSPSATRTYSANEPRPG